MDPGMNDSGWVGGCFYSSSLKVNTETGATLSSETAKPPSLILTDILAARDIKGSKGFETFQSASSSIIV